MTTVSLTQLVTDRNNVRQSASSSDGIAALASSIRSIGLINPLTVRRVGKKDPAIYGVIAGSRRLAALTLLAQQGYIPADYPVQVSIRGRDTTDAVILSLAENVMREEMTPADTLRAYFAAHEKGVSVPEIAVTFGTSEAQVSRTLRLASVAKPVFEAFRTGRFGLDVLKAFGATEDHERQSRVFEACEAHGGFNTYSIRRELREGRMMVRHPTFQYVGMEAYLAAGGGIERDLFAEDHDSVVLDTDLVATLAQTALEREAEVYRQQGWGEVVVSLDAWEARDGLTLLPPNLTAEMAQQLEDVEEGIDAMSGYPDDPEAVAEIASLLEERDGLVDTARNHPAEVKANAVLIVGLDRGDLVVWPCIREEETSEADDQPEGEVIDFPVHGSVESAGKPVHSDALMAELTALRTDALRVEVTGNQRVALIIAVANLAGSLFYSHRPVSCSSISLTYDSLERYAPYITATPARREQLNHHDNWKSRLPENPDDFWDWLLEKGLFELMELLSYCVAQSLNTVESKHILDRRDQRAAGQALARLTGLDMRDWWEATAASYFARVSKARTLAILAEHCGPQVADNLRSLKKEALAQAAAERMQGKGWLPPELDGYRPLDDEPADAARTDAA